MRGSVLGSVVRSKSLMPVAGMDVTGVRAAMEGVGGLTDGAEVSVVGAVSDESGEFFFDTLEPGPWVFEVKDANGSRVGGATVEVHDNAVSELTVEMMFLPRAPGKQKAAGATRPSRRDRNGGVSGRVVSLDDAMPLADVAISVVRGPGPAPDIGPLSDESGHFALDDLPPGNWFLRAMGPSGETTESMVRVNPGAVTQVTIHMGASRSGEPESN